MSHLPASLDDKLENVVRECQRHISETGEALRSDVRSRVEAVSGGVASLEREVGEKAGSGDMRVLSEEVAKLKKTLRDSVSDVEKSVCKLYLKFMSTTAEAMADVVEGPINRVHHCSPSNGMNQLRCRESNISKLQVINIALSMLVGARFAAFAFPTRQVARDEIEAGPSEA